ncbi:MAG: glycosyltransferase family 9 protein [Muribaculaceae bacterium]|nr:glycosyltransferase family 9 protein [Muribaculaceae bacterium]
MGQKNDIGAYTDCVLITRFSALGDVCMTIPIVYGVCAANPEVRFVMLTRKAAASMFVNRPENLTVTFADLKGEYGGTLGAVRLMRHMCHTYGVKRMADLHNVLRTRMMGLYGRTQGVKVARLDKCRRLRSMLIKQGAYSPESISISAVTDRYADVFRRLGLAVPAEYPKAPAAGLPASLFGKVTAEKPAGERWIAVAPFAAHRSKIYPLEQMRSVVEQIASWTGTKVFLLGGGSREEEVLREWTAMNPGTIRCVAGAGIGFGGELALLGRMDAAVTMDSANMHLASLAGVPVVSVWGATHPASGFYGWRQDRANAVQLPMACRPCSVFGSKPCRKGTYECLTGISPESVVKKLKEIL